MARSKGTQLLRQIEDNKGKRAHLLRIGLVCIYLGAPPRKNMGPSALASTYEYAQTPYTAHFPMSTWLQMSILSFCGGGTHLLRNTAHTSCFRKPTHGFGHSPAFHFTFAE